MRARLWPTVAAPATVLYTVGAPRHARAVIAVGARILLTVAALATLLYTIGAPVSNGG